MLPSAPRAYRSHGVGADPGAVLGVVADATAAGRVVLGLTTPTTLMIARQVAAPHGYGLAFHGEHDYLGNDRLRHHLRGDDAWLGDLATLLEHSADAWPQALGRTLAGLPADRECTATQAVTCAARQPARNPGQLRVLGARAAAGLSADSRYGRSPPFQQEKPDMPQALPDWLTPQQFFQAVEEMRAVVGKQWVVVRGRPGAAQLPRRLLARGRRRVPAVGRGRPGRRGADPENPEDRQRLPRAAVDHLQRQELRLRRSRRRARPATWCWT